MSSPKSSRVKKKGAMRKPCDI